MDLRGLPRDLGGLLYRTESSALNKIGTDCM
jgi:hypothetical protein